MKICPIFKSHKYVHQNMFWYRQTTCHMIMKIIFQFLAQRSQVGLQEYEPEEFQRQHNAQAWSCVLQRDVSIFYRTYTMPTKQSIPLQRIPNIIIIPLHTMSTLYLAYLCIQWLRFFSILLQTMSIILSIPLHILPTIGTL